MNKITPIIGLEVHVELKTNSKMFCSCSADYFGQKPNTHCCPVCLGLPGALPVPNKKAVEWCILIGLALNCKVNESSYFERKNYFYPDLPKGYQISQYNMPLTYSGVVEIGGGKGKTIRINRVHMEEDTGKLTHAEVNGEKCTLIDFNRSGVPLVEIVTEPDFNSTEDVSVYLKKLHKIIKYLSVSDADMEKGSMRLEPTVNLKITKNGEDFFTPLVEIKNINSFRFVKQALEYEIKRQESEFEKTGIAKTAGNKTTVGFNEEKKETYLQRAKEEANDYRYFPEPDIPPMSWTKEDVEKLRLQIPELPDDKIARFINKYGINEYDALLLTENPEVAMYYEDCIKYLVLSIKQKGITNKIIANWIINKKADIKKVSPEELLKLIAQQFQTSSITDEELEKIVKKVVTENPKAVTDLKAGKEQAMMFLVGQVMKTVKDNNLVDKIKILIKNI